MPHELSFSKTRLAPTPGGYLHAGNALNFLLTQALARQSGAGILLRIDDLDRERYRTAYARDIFDTLRFLNIPWSEGPQNVDDFEAKWSQRCRMNLYRDALERLRRNNHVFACTCSRTQSGNCTCYDKGLSLDAPDTSWRVMTDADAIAVRTVDGRLEIAPLPAEMKNFIVRKKDGLPAYQLSSVADDLHFGIDLIVRGADLWPSTLAQHFLAKRLGDERFASIAFYHHPLLADERGEKLSKSAGALSVMQWRESGKSLPDFFAFIGTLLPVEQPENAAALLKTLNANRREEDTGKST